MVIDFTRHLIENETPIHWGKERPADAWVFSATTPSMKPGREPGICLHLTVFQVADITVPASLSVPDLGKHSMLHAIYKHSPHAIMTGFKLRPLQGGQRS